MREIPDLLQAHLDGAVTTLCQAWRVVRRDGRVFGFTDHDVVLTFDDLAYQPMSGFLGSDVEQALGLQTQTSEVAGALSSAAITEADILAGRFDGARVETYLVNWAEISQRLLLNVQTIGEVTWAGSAFSAELRSLFHGLDQIQGRVYARRCDAALGDRRCGVDLDNPAFHAVVTIAEATGLRAVTVDGLDGFAPGWMRHGRLTFTSGANADLSVQIDDHGVDDTGLVHLTFWTDMPHLPAPGDGCRVDAGCAKTFEACRQKFNNSVRFQGFPHLPGADFSYGYADGETVHDGRVLVP
jgi:uncharacterized phage protein (TIGR02218 family)